MTKAAQMRAQWGKLLDDAKVITTAAETEDRDLTSDEKTSIEAMLSDARALKSTFTVLEGLDSEHREAHERREPRAGRPATDGQPEGPAPVDRRSIGQRFVESSEWTEFRQRVAPNGFSEKTNIGVSPAVQFRSLLTPTRNEQRTIVTGASDTSGGALVFNDVQPGLYPQGLQRPLTIRDIITVGSTDSDTVEYVRMTSQTNAAAPTVEATATGDASGAKPESALALAKVTTAVKTIAHWIPATKRALSDAGQLRTLIDNFLRYGLEEELEDQIMAGNAAGENFDGIGHVTGVQSQAWDTNILTTTRKARTLVRTVGRSIPTAYVLHPIDWETLDLTQDAEERYYFGGPAQMGVPRLWGLPVVESEAAPEGTGYVGDFRKAVLWEREQASIQVSDSHSDFFIRNMVAILAEMRAAFGVVQPNAFVEIDLASGS
jgi:HK97 family phage major capsid protein